MRYVFAKMKQESVNPRSALDYGCGEGRYLAVLKEFFPQMRLAGCDISEVGLRLAKKHHPFAEFRLMRDETTDFPDRSFDLVISVEVLEHVGDVTKSVKEISRLLAPGGLAVLTTPCANRFSIEWFYNVITGGFQPSHDGYGRFATDEDGHLRRLTDTHIRELFGSHGVEIFKIYHRAHVFTMPVEHFPFLWLLPLRLRAEAALLDWRLSKNRSNGATMVALGRKPAA